MTALITIRQAGATIACDRGCYGAKHARCDCQVCGGLNHGAGLILAIQHTQDHHPAWIAAAGEGAEAELDDIVFQPPLFAIGDHPMSDSQKLTRISTTERGVGVYAELTDCYGADVSVRQSSSATRDAVWVFAEGGSIAGNKGAAHLEAHQARQVRDGLTAWLTEIGADQ